MARTLHRLTNVDPVARTADCAACGERVDVYGCADGRAWQCAGQAKARKAERVALGVCVNHPDRPAVGGTVHCQQCRDSRSRSDRGLTRDEWDAKFADQGGVCAVPGCGREATVLDHDHDLPKSDPASHRGLLCNNCNVAIGMLSDSPRRARGLAAYLDRFSAHTVFEMEAE